MTLAVFRFFRTAAPMPSWLATLTACIGLYAAVVTWLHPEGVDDALATLVLWQMFCASTGFGRDAGAGHFDTALVRWPRARVALGHALHSVWPVVTLWLIIGAIEAFSAGRYPLALEAGRLSALFFVSVAAWALSLPGGRLVTGSVWLLLIVAAAMTRVGASQYAAMLAEPDGGLSQILRAAALTIACPFLLIGDHIPPRHAVTAIVTAAAIVALGVGMAYVRRRDYALEAAI